MFKVKVLHQSVDQSSLFAGPDHWCQRYGRDLCTADGWLVWLRRVDNSVLFNRTWAEYQRGFGDKSGNYWLGLNELHSLTYNYLTHSGKTCKIKADLESWSGEIKWAEYGLFLVFGESENYRLLVDNYNTDSTAPDMMKNNKEFSTLDQDNDLYSSKYESGSELR